MAKGGHVQPERLFGSGSVAARLAEREQQEQPPAAPSLLPPPDQATPPQLTWFELQDARFTTGAAAVAIAAQEARADEVRMSWPAPALHPANSTVRRLQLLLRAGSRGAPQEHRQRRRACRDRALPPAALPVALDDWEPPAKRLRLPWVCPSQWRPPCEADAARARCGHVNTVNVHRCVQCGAARGDDQPQRRVWAVLQSADTDATSLKQVRARLRTECGSDPSLGLQCDDAAALKLEVAAFLRDLQPVPRGSAAAPAQPPRQPPGAPQQPRASIAPGAATQAPVQRHPSGPRPEEEEEDVMGLLEAMGCPSDAQPLHACLLDLLRRAAPAQRPPARHAAPDAATTTAPPAPPGGPPPQHVVVQGGAEGPGEVSSSPLGPGSDVRGAVAFGGGSGTTAAPRSASPDAERADVRRQHLAAHLASVGCSLLQRFLKQQQQQQQQLGQRLAAGTGRGSGRAATTTCAPYQVKASWLEGLEPEARGVDARAVQDAQALIRWVASELDSAVLGPDHSPSAPPCGPHAYTGRWPHVTRDEIAAPIAARALRRALPAATLAAVLDRTAALAQLALQRFLDAAAHLPVVTRTFTDGESGVTLLQEVLPPSAWVFRRTWLDRGDGRAQHARQHGEGCAYVPTGVTVRRDGDGPRMRRVARTLQRLVLAFRPYSHDEIMRAWAAAPPWRLRPLDARAVGAWPLGGGAAAAGPLRVGPPSAPLPVSDLQTSAPGTSAISDADQDPSGSDSGSSSATSGSSSSSNGGGGGSGSAASSSSSASGSSAASSGKGRRPQQPRHKHRRRATRAARVTAAGQTVAAGGAAAAGVQTQVNHAPGPFIAPNGARRALVARGAWAVWHASAAPSAVASTAGASASSAALPTGDGSQWLHQQPVAELVADLPEQAASVLQLASSMGLPPEALGRAIKRVRMIFGTSGVEAPQDYVVERCLS